MRWSSLVARVGSVLWLAVATLQIALAAVPPVGVLHESRLSFALRACIVVTELAALAILVVGVAIALSLLRGLLQRALPALAGSRPAAVLLGGGVASLAFFLLGSWGLRIATGHFLDVTALSFLAQSPVLVLRHLTHMAPATVLVIPALSLVFGVAACFLASRLAAVRCPRLVRGAALASALCGAVALAGWSLASRETRPVVDELTGTSWTTSGLYLAMLDSRAGPAASLASDLARRIRPRKVSLAEIEQRFTVIRRRQLALEQYRAMAARSGAARANVVFVLVESLRGDQLMAGGSSREVMPNLEKLARKGSVFNRVYAQASHSNYADLCPLSSHYPLRSASGHNPPRHPTYPRVLLYDLLKAVGYRTALISSQNEDWGAMLNYLDTGGLDTILHAGNYQGDTYVPRRDTGFAQWVKGEKRAGKIDDRFTISEAIRWIGSGGEPFFLYLNLQSSHVPFEVPADFPRRFGPESIDFPLTFGSFPRDKVAVVKDLYADSLAYVDSQLGRLIDHLGQRGLLETTIFVVSGDTGQAFFEHGFAAHGNQLFDEVLRVPIVVSGPGVAIADDARLAQHIDVAPTLLELLGLPPHPSFQGVSLLAPPSPSRSVYLVVQTPWAWQYGVVRGESKLIYDARRSSYLLFDLGRDPEEKRNIASSQPALTADLAQRLQAWFRLQVEYYSNAPRHMTQYPPVIVD